VIVSPTTCPRQPWPCGPSGRPRPLAREEAFALEGLLPVYNDRCAELAASPVPDSLQHDDLHSNNACWPGEADDLSSVRIIDWGDASVGHPFETMLATLNSIAFHAGALRVDRRMDDPRLLRIWDAYMEPFAAWAALRDYCAGWRWPEVP
jgi:aminoglycoside phosphotransferase (APT) family kinase protein